MKQLLAVVAIASVTAGHALASDLEPITFPSTNGAVSFTHPTNNIECTYTPAHSLGVHSSTDDFAEVSCDRVEPYYVRVVLGEKIKPHILKHVLDSGCCSADTIFPYGRSWREGPFECDSRADGVLCRRKDGHGFKLSSSEARVF